MWNVRHILEGGTEDALNVVSLDMRRINFFGRGSLLKVSYMVLAT